MSGSAKKDRKVSPPTGGRTRGEKSEKYSAIWSSTDKVKDSHAQKSIEALRDICKIQDQDMDNIKEMMRAMCDEAIEQVKEETLRKMQEWKNEIYEEVRAHFTSWQVDIESSLQERNRVIAELQQEITSCKNQLDLIRKEEGEITESVPEKVKSEIHEMKTQMAKEINTWAAVVKQAQADTAEHSKWIEVAKKIPNQKEEFINAAIEEEKRRKIRALHVRVVGWKEGDSPMEDAKGICGKIGVEDPSIVEKAWRVGKESADKGRPLILKFNNLESRRSFLSKRTTLKGQKIYLEDDLTPAQVAHRRECMPQIMEARKAGKWAVYRDGRVIITEKRQ